jgi:hypothetical protein
MDSLPILHNQRPNKRRSDVVVTADGILVDHKASDWAAVRRQLSVIDPAAAGEDAAEPCQRSQPALPYGRYLDAQSRRDLRSCAI